MSKHTSGPWKFTHLKKTGFYHITKELNDNDALMCDLMIHDGKELEAEANARLISAAPELLEALEYLLQSYRADFNNITGGELNNTEAVLKAIAAINKAKTNK